MSLQALGFIIVTREWKRELPLRERKTTAHFTRLRRAYFVYAKADLKDPFYSRLYEVTQTFVSRGNLFGQHGLNV